MFPRKAKYQREGAHPVQISGRGDPFRSNTRAALSFEDEKPNWGYPSRSNNSDGLSKGKKGKGRKKGETGKKGKIGKIGKIGNIGKIGKKGKNGV